MTFKRGKASDRSALRAHVSRLNPTLEPGRYSVSTYAVRMAISPEAVRDKNWPNLSNRWRQAHGKRGGWRRRYEPYRDEASRE